MKRLLFLLMALSLTTMVTAGPEYMFSFSGNWIEAGTPGQAGNIFTMENGNLDFIENPGVSPAFSTFFDITANNEGAHANTSTNPLLIGFQNETPYSGTITIESFFDVWTDLEFDVDIVNYSSTDSDGNGSFFFIGEGTDTQGRGYSIQFACDTGLFFGNWGSDGFMMGGFGEVAVPAPGALLLGSLGVGLVGVIRRRLA